MNARRARYIDVEFIGEGPKGDTVVMQTVDGRQFEVEKLIAEFFYVPVLDTTAEVGGSI